MKSWLKRNKIWVGVTSILMVLVLLLTSIQFVVPLSTTAKNVLVIGPRTAEATSTTPDYTTTGSADNTVFQTALNALPSGGGELVVLAGTYTWTAGNHVVSRAINNVTIVGVGPATIFNCDASNKIFSAGSQTGWTFRDFKTDAGGLTYTSATNYILENITIGSTYYSYLTSGALTASQVNAPTSGTASWVMATSDATTQEKSHANVILTGTNDYSLIQTALDSLGDHTTLEIIGPTVNLGATGITASNKHYFTLDIESQVFYTGTGRAISLVGNVAGSADTYGDRYFIKRVIASGSAVTSASAVGIYMSGLLDFSITSECDAFKAGAGVQFDSEASSGLSLEWGKNINFTFYDCGNGIYATGDLPTAFLDIAHMTYQIQDTGKSGYKAINIEDNTYDALQWHIGQMLVYPNSHLGCAVSGSKSKILNIGELICDGWPSGATAFVAFNSVDPTTRVGICHYWGMPTASLVVVGSTLVPIVRSFYADGVKQWDDINTSMGMGIENWVNYFHVGSAGSGRGGLLQASGYWVGTGITASSNSYADWLLTEMNLAGDYFGIDWSANFHLRFALSAGSSDTQATRYFALKNNETIGDLDVLGLGVKLTNLTLTGQAYGATGLGTLSLGSVTPGTLYWIDIIKTSNGVIFLVKVPAQVPVEIVKSI